MSARKSMAGGLLLLAAVVTGPAAASSGNTTVPAEILPVPTKGLGSLSGYYLAARHANLRKDLSAAAGFFHSALIADPDNLELLENAVLLNVASGNIRRAAELSNDLLERNPTDQVALMTLAVAAIRAGKPDEAFTYVERLGDLGGQLQELVSLLMDVWTMVLDGHAAQAIAKLEEEKGPAWFNTFTNLHAGLIADHARLFEVAEDRLRLAVERDPTAIRVVDAYARSLARAGKEERALTVLDTFEERLGGNQHFTEALRAEIEGDGPVAPQISHPREGVAEALHGIGTAISRDGGDTFGASMLQFSLYLAPDGYYPAMALGNVFEAMRQYQAAIDVYRAIPGNNALKRNARVQEALNLNILERHDEAIAILVDLVREDPRDVGTAIALGNVYRSRERFAEAAEIYTAAIAALGDVPQPFWTLYYYRGIAHERTGRWTAAEKDFRKALEMQPEQPLVLNYLGYSYIDRGENLDEALGMVRRAVKQRPEDGYIVDSLGWAYYRLGRYNDAVRELEKAVHLRPADPVINDHLGDAYWMVGRKLEAMFQWSHARDSEPEPDALEIILHKLENGLPESGVPPRIRAAASDTGTETDAAQ
ncbi:MAG: tetratricopeptide repeat protein [Devosia sp.]